MLEIQNLTKRYGKLVALNEVSFSLDPGQIVSLTGPNGSGKTTLLKSILGLIRPDNGTILLNGESIIGKWQYREFIGYMPQISRYPENLTIGNFLDMIAELRQKKLSECSLELYYDFNLDRLSDKRLGALSGGTRQKVAAVASLLFTPKLLIMDEPTAGLDPIATDILLKHIHIASETGALILITSHVLTEVQALAERVIYMNEGQVEMNLTPNELFEQTGAGNIVQAIKKKFEDTLLKPQL